MIKPWNKPQSRGKPTITEIQRGGAVLMVPEGTNAEVTEVMDTPPGGETHVEEVPDEAMTPGSPLPTHSSSGGAN